MSQLWALKDIEQEITATGVKITVITFQPCHLWLRYSLIEPKQHIVPVLKRGVPFHADKYFCFDSYHDNEQAEAGDTLTHTFIKEPWAICQTRWFYFCGTIAGQPSPSESPIFKKHRVAPPPTNIFYSNKHPETTSVDGVVARIYPAQDWAGIRNDPGTLAEDSTSGLFVWIRSTNPTGTKKYYELYRAIMLWDLSVAHGYTITAAKFHCWGTGKWNTPNISPSLNIFKANPASNIALAPADYQCLSSVPAGVAIPYTAFIINAWNDLHLNTHGIAIINAALAADGIVKLGLREATYDAPNVDPFPGQANQVISFGVLSVDTTTPNKPYLMVTYA